MHRGLPDVVSAGTHGFEALFIVRGFLTAPQLRHALVIALEVINQHLLVLKTGIKQQLIQGLGFRAGGAPGISGMNLFPPGTNHRAAAEEGELGRGDQAISHR